LSENPAHVTAEAAVLQVVRDAIGDASIAPHDDFYQAGGHSLLILKITRRLHEEFALDLDLRQFWVNARMDALAAACRPTVPEGVAGDGR
jgi:hypothetical protein